MSPTQLEYNWDIKDQFGLGTDPSIEFNGYWDNVGISITDSAGVDVPSAYASFWASTNEVLAVLAKPSLGSLNSTQILLDKNVFGTISNVSAIYNGGTTIALATLDQPDAVVLPSFDIGQKDFRLIRFTKSNPDTIFRGTYRETAVYDELPPHARRDSSTHGNHIRNTMHCERIAGQTSPDLGQAVQLQMGNGAFMMVPHDPSLNPAAHLTVEAWVKSDPSYQDTGMAIYRHLGAFQPAS